MDLSSPLHSLAPSLDSAVLGVLAGTESSLSLSRIAQLADRGTRQGLTLAVERLVGQGLVIATEANRGSMYRFNRAHVLADAVISVAHARVTILARLADHVARMHPEPLHVSVFGSFARRDAGDQSDIDVLFVLADQPDEAWHEQAAALSDLVLSWTGNRMEYLAFGMGDLLGLVKRKEPIVASWLADSVTVHGQAIETVLAATASRRHRARP